MEPRTINEGPNSNDEGTMTTNEVPRSTDEGEGLPMEEPTRFFIVPVLSVRRVDIGITRPTLFLI